MIFKLFAIVIVLGLLYIAYKRLPAPAQISQPVAAHDNQFEVFRDMEPEDQTRQNSWVGFIQEDVKKNRTGPIGDFTGHDSASGNAALYAIT